MEVFLFVLLLVGFVAFRLFVPKMMNFGFKKANQNVFQRDAHQQGQSLVQKRLTFNADASVEAVRSAVLSTVNVTTEVPTLKGDLYLGESTNTRITYIYGNKFKDHFRAVLVLSSHSFGTSGYWEVTNWVESTGMVSGRPIMERLIADINRALRSVDPKARLQ